MSDWRDAFDPLINHSVLDEPHKRLVAIKRRLKPKLRATVVGTVDVPVGDLEWLLAMAERAVEDMR